MQIQQGIVKYKDRSDLICNYGITDDGKQYYFLDDKPLPNGNIIATTLLVEAVDPTVKISHAGLITRDGKVVIPLENRTVKNLGNNVLLVERTIPISKNVLESIGLKNLPEAATKLVTTPATIKDRLMLKMENEGRFVFNDQFSEASIFDYDGKNLIDNEYFSFIGMNAKKIYLSKNTVDSVIVEYSLFPEKVAVESNDKDKIKVEEVAKDNKDKIEKAINGEMANAFKVATDANSVKLPSVNIPVGQVPVVPKKEGVPVKPTPIIPKKEDAPVNPAPIAPKKEDAPVEPTPIAPKKEDVPVEPVPIIPKKDDVPVEPVPIIPKKDDVPVEPVPIVPKKEDVPIEPVPIAPKKEDAPVEPVPIVPKKEDVPVEPVPIIPKKEDVPVDPVPIALEKEEVSDTTKKEATEEKKDLDGEDEQIPIVPEDVSEVETQDNLLDNIANETSGKLLDASEVAKVVGKEQNSDDVKTKLDIEDEKNDDTEVNINFDLGNNKVNDIFSKEEDSEDYNVFDSPKKDLTDEDLFGDSILNLDKISFDYDDERSFDNTNIIDDLTKSLSNLINLNKKQSSKMVDYEKMISRLRKSNNDIVKKNKSLEEEVRYANGRVRNYETIVSKLENRNRELDEKVQEQNKKIKDQEEEITSLKPSDTSKEKLLKLIADANSLIDEEDELDYRKVV